MWKSQTMRVRVAIILLLVVIPLDCEAKWRIEWRDHSTSIIWRGRSGLYGIMERRYLERQGYSEPSKELRIHWSGHPHVFHFGLDTVLFGFVCAIGMGWYVIWCWRRSTRQEEDGEIE